MNIKRLLFSFASIALFALCAQAQDKLQMRITGTSTTTDDNGHIIFQPINNRTLLQAVGKISNLTDISWLGLAYHVGGNDLGDTIDVINRTNGQVLRTLFGLYFGEAFGRMELVSSDNHSKRIEYIYTDQNSHSLGSVVLNDFYKINQNGTTNHTLIVGSHMTYLILPDANHDKVRVCTASFTTLQPWKFPGQ